MNGIVSTIQSIHWLVMSPAGTLLVYCAKDMYIDKKSHQLRITSCSFYGKLQMLLRCLSDTISFTHCPFCRGRLWRTRQPALGQVGEGEQAGGSRGRSCVRTRGWGVWVGHTEKGVVESWYLRIYILECLGPVYEM